ncbi:uncharacterized protein DSM5745_06426 [Aspergillus mulundensis]|uniref:Uncharacterized protein n=1 Tax=Aspergillus mulundensis TaxID=1810919 RepID=A0A3D8RRE4_9EURO|nr:hypothetical protein DSM5745_06426 [Aspergillus mulundensis]RDW76434.1 hypothetical protein DSM5745_06426 [Aspergillus mulundensis]
MEQRTALVTLGRCTWHGANDFKCHCTSGSSILSLGETHDDLKCRSCGHTLSTHEDYELDEGSQQPATKQQSQKQQSEWQHHGDGFYSGTGSWGIGYHEPTTSWSATHSQIMTPASTNHGDVSDSWGKPNCEPSTSWGSVNCEPSTCSGEVDCEPLISCGEVDCEPSTSWGKVHCEPPPSSPKFHDTPRSLVTGPFALPDSTIPRQELVDELIDQVEERRIIRVNGIPGSGKTTMMHLMVNTLLKKYDDTLPIHTITGWNMDVVTDAGGWNPYLKTVTGVAGNDWHTNTAFLLIDEAHQLYGDLLIWADFFGRICSSSSSRIVLFTSYGLPHHVEYHSEISPQRMLSEQEQLTPLSMKPFGLYLLSDEAKEFVIKYASEYMPSSSINFTKALHDALLEGSNWHIGILKGLVDMLLQSNTVQDLIKTNRPVSWATAREVLLQILEKLVLRQSRTPRRSRH